tara:strand:+ start:479 stop:679 length:201 start_codon:yes stop_codon:yes gene_type:complete
MSKCTKCSDGTMQDAKYICRSNDYAIVDVDDNLLEKIEDHSIPSGDSELGDYVNIKYCSCGKSWKN